MAVNKAATEASTRPNHRSSQAEDGHLLSQQRSANTMILILVDGPTPIHSREWAKFSWHECPEYPAQKAQNCCFVKRRCDGQGALTHGH
eukprot:scaffold263374_cov16-Prasinocladus_malaysianus.AAC.1